MSATRRMPRASSASAAFGPTPHNVRTGSPARKTCVSGSLTISSPSGLERVEAIFATCFVAATPTLQTRPVSARTRARSIRAISPGEPQRRRAPDTSRNASSIDRGSTSGVTSWKIDITWRESAE